MFLQKTDGMKASANPISDLRKDPYSYLHHLPIELIQKLVQYVCNIKNNPGLQHVLRQHALDNIMPQVIDVTDKSPCRFEFDPIHNHLFVVSKSSIQVLDLETTKCIKKRDFPGIVNFVLDIPNNRLFGGGYEGTVGIFDLTTLETITHKREHVSGVTCLAINNNKNKLISGEEIGIIKVWDLSKFSCIHTINVGTQINSIIIDHKNNQFITSDSVNIKIWDLETATLKKTLPANVGNLLILLESKNQLITAQSCRTIIYIWDLETGKCIKKINSDDSIYDYLFGHLHNQLIVGLQLGTQIWDFKTGICIHYTPTIFYSEPKTYIAGTRLFTQDRSSGQIKIWNLAEIPLQKWFDNLPVEYQATYLNLFNEVYRCYFNRNPLNLKDNPRMYYIFASLHPDLQKTISTMLKVIVPEKLNQKKENWHEFLFGKPE